MGSAHFLAATQEPAAYAVELLVERAIRTTTILKS
jgi:hypothetical protein